MNMILDTYMLGVKNTDLNQKLKTEEEV